MQRPPVCQSLIPRPSVLAPDHLSLPAATQFDASLAVSQGSTGRKRNKSSMTNLLSSDSFLPSGGLDFDMSAASASILSSSSRPTNQRFSSIPPHGPPFPLWSLPSPSPPHARDPLPDFTFPPSNPLASDSSDNNHRIGHSFMLRDSPSPARSADQPLLGHGEPAQQSSEPSARLIQRLTQQNALIRDAWEAERNYLEANRRRAEEVYQEERAIMEDLREAWQHERAQLLRTNQLLRERIQRLEGENSTLKAMTSRSIAHVTGVLSPLASQQGDSFDGSAEHSPTAFPAAATDVADVAALEYEQALLHDHLGNHIHHGVLSTSAAAASLPPGLDGASRRPHFASPPRQLPSSPPAILDPRTQPAQSVMHDFLAAATTSDDDDHQAPFAIIDVQEIDPKLEGISLRATAVQKSTFSQEAPQSPADDSPPAMSSRRQNRRGGSHLLRHGPSKAGPSKAQTMQALAAGETRRLTMHAGHTPNHSLSLFPTMTTATGASSVVTRSGDTTPMGAASSPPPEEEDHEHADNDVTTEGGDFHGGPRDDDEGPVKEAEDTEELGLADEGEGEDGTIWKRRRRRRRRREKDDERGEDDEDEMEGEDGGDAPLHLDEVGYVEELPLRPSDEGPPLKGPLMVKNIPAQDELFWAAVNKKLEPISQGQDALPTVVQTPVAELDASRWADVIPVGGGDAARDAHVAPAAVEDDGICVEEPDVPLKIRTTTNFGAPFGMM